MDCITDGRGARLLETAATLRVRAPKRNSPAVSGNCDDPVLDHRRYSEPRPQTLVDWLVWLALWPIVTVAWLVVVPFVLTYVAIGFIMEVLFGIRLRRGDDSDGTDSPRMRF